jgi:LysR family transcriptional regulator, glycine cleavage system transcriptional activator
MRKLPPLNALIAFESIARLGSVKAASDELCVTPSAISHHLANLEEYLRTNLFHRKNRRLFLTDVGKDYLKQLGPAFDAISNASTEASTLAGREILTVSAPPSLVTNWLIPRLSTFLKANANLNVKIFEKMEMDPDIREIDCAIEYRFQASMDYKSFHLIPDDRVPLMSPSLFKRNKVSCVQNLKGITLIETQRRLCSWQIILADFSWLKTQRIIEVPYSLHAFKAAEVGLGVALGNLYNANGYIQEGRLCVPFKLDAKILQPMPRYFFSVLPHKENLPKIIAFSSWIQREVGKINSSHV